MNSIRPSFAETPQPKFYSGSVIEDYALTKDLNLDLDQLGQPREKFDIPDYGLTIGLDPQIQRRDFRGMAKAQQAMRMARTMVSETEQGKAKWGAAAAPEYCIATQLTEDDLDGARACILGPQSDIAWEHRVQKRSDGTEEVTDFAYKREGNVSHYAIRDSSGAYVVSDNGNGTLSISVYEGLPPSQA